MRDILFCFGGFATKAVVMVVNEINSNESLLLFCLL